MTGAEQAKDPRHPQGAGESQYHPRHAQPLNVWKFTWIRNGFPLFSSKMELH